MSEEKKTIIVPWDFTEVAEYALQHAVNFAKRIDNEITLLHIVDKGGLLASNSKKVKEAITATNKINAKACDVTAKTGIKTQGIVLEGSIFTTIADIASQLNVSLFVMGTHGVKGMQKITGSWAIKVISSSDYPFVVVQGPPAKEEYNNVVFPVDFQKETTEKLAWAQFLSKYYNTKIRIVQQDYAGTKVSSNIAVARKYFQKNNVQYDIFEPPKKKDFAESVITYAKRIKADLILITISKNIWVSDYILGLEEQTIISNDHNIPVMCINPGNKVLKI